MACRPPAEEPEPAQVPPVAGLRSVEESDMEKRLALLLRRVLEFRSKLTVGLGIEGPRDVSVHRKEIQDRIGTGERVLFRESDQVAETSDEFEPSLAARSPIEESDMEKWLALLLRRVLEFRTKLPVGLAIEAQTCLDDRQKTFKMD